MEFNYGVYEFDNACSNYSEPVQDAVYGRVSRLRELDYVILAVL